MHDVICAEETLAGLTGTAIEYGGYVFDALKKSLAKSGMRLIAKHRRNMAPNSSDGQKLLKNDPLSKP